MPFDALKFFLPGFFVLFALGIFASTCPANVQSQGGQAKTPPARQSPTEKQGLDFSVGPRGLDSLSYNGQSLLASPRSGELQPWKSVFRTVLDAFFSGSPSPVAPPNKQTDTNRPEDHAARLNAVRRGDILLFNCWYHNDGAQKVKKLYEEAGIAR